MTRKANVATPADGRAWITGAGKGLGRALALRLAADGLDTAGALAAVIGHGPRPQDRTAADAERPIALAVLNAGTHQPMPAKEFDPEIFDKLIALNIGGQVNCLAALIPAMRRRGRGQIAVVASVAGYMGLPTAAAYGLSKAGVINMCESLHPELAQEGVLLQVVNPGFVRTPLTDKNEFEMPFLMEPDAAAEAFAKGLKSRRFEIYFPKLFVRLMKLLRALPYGLSLRLTAKTVPGETP